MKYPRTYHLPWSPGATRDDRIQSDISNFIDEQIVITEKLDGSNVTLTQDNVFARSHSGPPDHPSFDPLKALHASKKHLIKEYFPGVEIFGEWCYAKHSIYYTELPSYLLCFAIRIGGVWLKWRKVERYCEALDLKTVPVLYKGSVGSEKELKDIVEYLCEKPSECGGDREGVVVRVADDFTDDCFSTHLLKQVRKDHVQTDTHWKHQEIQKNLLSVQNKTS